MKIKSLLIVLGTFLLCAQTGYAATDLQTELMKLQEQSSAHISTVVHLDWKDEAGNFVNGKVNFETILNQSQPESAMTQNLQYALKLKEVDTPEAVLVTLNLDYIFVDNEIYLRVNNLDIEGNSESVIVQKLQALRLLTGQWLLLDNKLDIYPLLNPNVRLFCTLDIFKTLAETSQFDESAITQMSASFFKKGVLTLNPQQQDFQGSPSFNFQLNRRAVFLAFQEIGAAILQNPNGPISISELFAYRRPIARSKSLAGALIMDPALEMMKGYTLHFSSQFGKPGIDRFDLSLVVDTQFDEWDQDFEIAAPDLFSTDTTILEEILDEDGLPTNTPEPLDQADPDTLLSPEEEAAMLDDDFALGDTDAPIIIAEFFDYESYLIKEMFVTVFPTIKEKYIDTGLVQWVYRDFPIVNHSQATKVAIAAECAGRQGKYQEMHDKIVISQPAISDNYLEKYAQDIVPDQNSYRDCVDLQLTEAEIQADQEYGLSLGVSVVPTYVINGEKFEGPLTLAEFEDAIRSKLLQKKVIPPRPADAIENFEDLIDDDTVMGDKNAPVTMVEFGDFECPFCIEHFKTVFPLIKKNYIDTGKLKFVFRDFPLDSHPQAKRAAHAAECAGEQNKYYTMHDQLFNGIYSFTENYLRTYASNIQLDAKRFDSCMSEKRYNPEIEKDIADGKALGITGVPTFFINGIKVTGAQSFQTFSDLIDQEYARSTNGQ